MMTKITRRHFKIPEVFVVDAPVFGSGSNFSAVLINTVLSLFGLCRNAFVFYR
jgi:hypothetical protein